MAQNQSRKAKTQSRRNNVDSDLDTGMESYDDSAAEDQDLDIEDETQTRSVRGQGQQRQTRQAGSQRNVPARDEAPDLMSSLTSSITPAIQEARRFVDGHPVRAAAIGAVAGGLLMTLFSTEKGRGFVRMAYDYANPMVAKYAREYVSRAAGEFAENAVSQH